MSEDDNKPDSANDASQEAAAQADIAAAHLAERAAKEAQSAPKPAAQDEASAGGEEAPDSELASAKAEAAQKHDLYLRAVAENENLRKRAEEQIVAAHKFALEQFARELLEVRDALEAAQSEGESAQGGEGGVALTLRKLTDAMTRHKILEVAPVAGAPFDPNLHQAIGVEKAADGAADNSVAKLVVKGYTLHGRLLRAAAVVVNKAEA
jgi:molecular chaperone GrpE